MALTLEIVSEHRELVGDDCVRVFRGEGGTIGRAFQNDWILPDPEKFISGRHASVDFKGGAWFLADTSTNGTYFNNDREPLGARKPRRLFDGDRLRMGEFEIVVRIDDGENLELPPEPEPSVVPDHIEQLVPEDAPRTGVNLLDENEITGDEEFRAALADEDSAPLESLSGEDEIQAAAEEETPSFEKTTYEIDSYLVEEEVATPSPGTPSGDQDARSTETEAAPLSAEAPAAESAGAPLSETGAGEAADRHDAREDVALASFLGGVGLSADDIPPDASVEQVMRNAGQVLREFVAGTGELLTLQENRQQECRFEESTELPGNRNPLKRTSNTSGAVRQLLVGGGKDFLGPQEAVHVAFRDLCKHEDALFEAMLAGCRELVQRFDPEELAEEFNRTLRGKPLPGALRRLKYWRLYAAQYAELVDTGESRFPRAFADELSRVYEQAFAGVSPAVDVDENPAEIAVELAETVEFAAGRAEKLAESVENAAGSAEEPADVVEEQQSPPGLLRESDFEQDVGSKLSFNLAADEEQAGN